MERSHPCVLVVVPPSSDDGVIRELISALERAGHCVHVRYPYSTEGRFACPGRAATSDSHSRPDVAVLGRHPSLSALSVRLRRITVVPLPASPAHIGQTVFDVERAAGVLANRPEVKPKAVVIAVPTYRRTEQLQTLLPQLVEQLEDAVDLIPGGRILVADNDPTGGAAGVVALCAARARVPIDYVHVLVPGVSAARNACLRSVPDGSLLAFIDDDQVPRTGWLRHLLLARQRTGADAIAGPTRPVYPAGTRRWIADGPFHDASRLPRDARMTLSAVTNFLLDVDVVRAMGIAFPEIGTRGGEDSWFTTSMAQRGAVITWEPCAVVDEGVPTPRTTPRWVLTRSLGNGVIAGRIGTRGIEDRSRALARGRLTTGGFLRVAGGGVRAMRGLLKGNAAMLGSGLHTTMRGLGMALGAWDLVFDEYARPGSRRWIVDRGADM